jgi:hypothetical protein
LGREVDQCQLGYNTYRCKALAEPGEYFLHVSSLFHGDDAAVILLVNPDQEGLLVVVPGVDGDDQGY